MNFKFIRLVMAILICQLAGIVGSFFTVAAVPTWYAFLNKPSFSPPSWLFGPVWVALYALMGLALYLVLEARDQKKDVRAALVVFAIQLILNAAWSIIFFGLKLPGLAWIEIMFLWLFILGSITSFYKVSRPAAWLLLPYFIWVSFASVLNFYVWRLNL